AVGPPCPGPSLPSRRARRVPPALRSSSPPRLLQQRRWLAVTARSTVRAERDIPASRSTPHPKVRQSERSSLQCRATGPRPETAMLDREREVARVVREVGLAGEAVDRGPEEGTPWLCFPHVPRRWIESGPMAATIEPSVSRTFPAKIAGSW